MCPLSFTVRAAAPTDVLSWSSLRHRLWASTSAHDHAREAEQLLAEPHRFPTVIAVSPAGEAFGFAEAAIRHDYVNGCDTSPVLFLEGIYVVRAMGRRLPVRDRLITAPLQNQMRETICPKQQVRRRRDRREK